MIARLFKRTLGWLPATVVLAVTLIAGARLITLSMQQHAERARVAAQAQAEHIATALEQQLQTVTDAARRQAERVDTSGGAADALANTAPVQNGFWVGADGAVLPGHHVPAALASSIASEWASIPARSAAAGASFLGPMREGSQWIVAARVPILPSHAEVAAQPIGWSVVYAELDRLLAATHLGGVVNAGYDFQVVQRQAAGGSARTFPPRMPLPSSIRSSAACTSRRALRPPSRTATLR